jgi:pyruvate dehydrogenase E1 component
VPQGRRYVVLGTDGFGRSDTRAALREYFRVDAGAIVKAVGAVR